MNNKDLKVTFEYCAIVLIFLIVLFKNALTSYPFELDIKIRYLDDIIVICLYAAMIIEMILRKFKRVHVGFIVIFILFAAIIFFQTLTLRLDPLKYNLIFFIRDNFWYFPVFYFIYRCDNKQEYDRYIKLIYLFMLIQISFFIVQFAYSGIFERRMLFSDDVNGSLGYRSSHKLSYVLLLIMPLLYSMRKKNLLLSSICIILLASARSSMIFFILTLLIYYLIISKATVVRKTIYILAVLVLSSGVYHLYNYYTDTTLRPQVLLYQQSRSLRPGRGANRISFLRYTVGLVKEKGLIVFGGGPGSYASRTGRNLKGYLYRQYEKDFPYDNEYISGGSSFNVWLGEMGIAGSALFILLYGYIIIVILKENRFYVLSIMPYILGLSVQKLNEAYAPSFLFWFMLGIALNRFTIEKQQERL